MFDVIVYSKHFGATELKYLLNNSNRNISINNMCVDIVSKTRPYLGGSPGCLDPPTEISLIFYEC
jgi:hypothetical protein